MAVHLEVPTLRHADAFVAAVRRSRALHRNLVTPPRTREQFQEYLRQFRGSSHAAHLVCLPGGEIAGVVNISEIVRGSFQSGYLGYYAFTPQAGHGHMTAGLTLVIIRAFGELHLHRLEANIQPGNARSVGLVTRLGFRLEGVSARYLKIAGRWRDHERWALTVEDWTAHRRDARARSAGV
jgi:ribosomal-protein-alanine N-acetyltransferase